MSKEVDSPEIVEAPAPDLAYPVVAEGTGKTAALEGAQAKTVYNVGLSALSFHYLPITDLVDRRPSCLRLSRKPR
jgi:hypothetical protein